MKRLIITVSLLAAAILSAAAQPKSIGIRTGAIGLEAVYQHRLDKNQFLEGDLGLDFGPFAGGSTGFRLSALYNKVWARPAWTEQGSWMIYTGAGFSTGYVYDKVKYDLGDNMSYNMLDNGFMFAIALQAGLEYSFDFPLQIAVDIRPYLGIHNNRGVIIEDKIKVSKSGFYNTGLAGLIPSLSFRYRF